MKVRITIIWAVPRQSKDETDYRGLALPNRTRLTEQRRAVLDLIADRQGSFTAIDLFEDARRGAPRLGLATVYRTVELLRRTGSVRPLAGDARPAYVRCEPGHHHHLVCLSCGAVEETELCGAPSASELRRRYGFRAEDHELEIYGTCARCA
jgi:Fur family transcriptional regulator, ferric uptake regulator